LSAGSVFVNSKVVGSRGGHAFCVALPGRIGFEKLVSKIASQGRKQIDIGDGFTRYDVTYPH